MMLSIDPVTLQRRLAEFSDLLKDTVDGGASIGFLPPLTEEAAEAYWNDVREALVVGSRILLAIERDGRIAGCVQLDLAQRPNARHRAEVMKLMVHTAQRKQGIGQKLMAAAEEAAVGAGRTLIVLDTRKGDPSVLLYRKIGYHEAGEIPFYARSASGELHATVFFWKRVAD